MVHSEFESESKSESEFEFENNDDFLLFEQFFQFLINLHDALEAAVTNDTFPYNIRPLVKLLYKNIEIIENCVGF